MVEKPEAMEAYVRCGPGCAALRLRRVRQGPGAGQRARPASASGEDLHRRLQVVLGEVVQERLAPPHEERKEADLR